MFVNEEIQEQMDVIIQSELSRILENKNVIYDVVDFDVGDLDNPGHSSYHSADGGRPPADGVRHPPDEARPPADGVRHPPDGVRPPSDDALPPNDHANAQNNTRKRNHTAHEDNVTEAQKREYIIEQEIRKNMDSLMVYGLTQIQIGTEKLATNFIMPKQANKNPTEDILKIHRDTLQVQYSIVSLNPNEKEVRTAAVDNIIEAAKKNDNKILEGINGIIERQVGHDHDMFKEDKYKLLETNTARFYASLRQGNLLLDTWVWLFYKSFGQYIFLLDATTTPPRIIFPCKYTSGIFTNPEADVKASKQIYLVTEAIQRARTSQVMSQSCFCVIQVKPNTDELEFEKWILQGGLAIMTTESRKMLEELWQHASTTDILCGGSASFPKSWNRDGAAGKKEIATVPVKINPGEQMLQVRSKLQSQEAVYIQEPKKIVGRSYEVTSVTYKGSDERNIPLKTMIYTLNYQYSWKNSKNETSTVIEKTVAYIKQNESKLIAKQTYISMQTAQITHDNACKYIDKTTRNRVQDVTNLWFWSIQHGDLLLDTVIWIFQNVLSVQVFECSINNELIATHPVEHQEGLITDKEAIPSLQWHHISTTHGASTSKAYKNDQTQKRFCIIHENMQKSEIIEGYVLEDEHAAKQFDLVWKSGGFKIGV